MYHVGKKSIVDTIHLREGTFELSPNGDLSVHAKLALISKEKGFNCGYFDATEALFSKKTKDALLALFSSIEEDVASLIFSEGSRSSPAETQQGLSPKGLGGI